jgi:hypothetical protein
MFGPARNGPLGCPRSGPGRPAHSRANLLRAFVAKAFFNIPHTRARIERLRSDPTLLRLCGFRYAADLPDETIFSRAFAEFSASQLPQRVHAALIQRNSSSPLVGHISRDASAIAVREKPRSKPKTKRQRASRRKQGRKPEQMTRLERQSLPGAALEPMLAELPRDCDKGCKKTARVCRNTGSATNCIGTWPMPTSRSARC